MLSMELPAPLPPPLAEALAARFRLLSDPMRIRLLSRLREGELSVGELADELGTSQQNVSKHLGGLLRDGVVDRRKEGNRAIYRIADDDMLELCESVCGSLERRASELHELVTAARG